MKHQQLIHWFKINKRDLPWRDTPSPYAVWVSEIMLQQTQVAVVIPYFLRWMEMFPSVEALAAAPLDQVIKCWEGLGYYSRARALHSGAKYLIEHHHGLLPIESEALMKIPGIGPYTNGAIRSFAFRQKNAAVDGNVIRVLTRYYNDPRDVSKQATVREIWKTAEAILPEEESWVFNEALIELGAMICTRVPKCQMCPIKHSCEAYANDTAAQLPFKSAKVKILHLHRGVAIIQSNNRLLVSKVGQKKIMSGLYEFPYIDFPHGANDWKALQDHIDLEFGLKTDFIDEMHEVKQAFTRYQLRLYPTIFKCATAPEIPGYQWLNKEELNLVAFSSGHRRIYDQVSITLDGHIKGS